MSEFRIGTAPVFEPGMKPGGVATGTPAGGVNGAVDFGELIKRSIDSVNETQQAASGLAERFELGDPGVDLVRVMVEMQKARLVARARTLAELAQADDTATGGAGGAEAAR